MLSRRDEVPDARRSVTVAKPLSIDLEIAEEFAELAMGFDASVRVLRVADFPAWPVPSHAADGKVARELLKLAAWEGDQIILEGTGKEANEVVEVLANHLEERPNGETVQCAAVCQRLFIVNPNGMDTRTCRVFSANATRYSARIFARRLFTLETEGFGRVADGKLPDQLASLHLLECHQMDVRALGDDALKMITALAGLVEAQADLCGQNGSPAVRRAVAVVNPLGLHGRPSVLFAKLAGTFIARILAKRRWGDHLAVAEARSFIEVLALALGQNDKFEIEAVGVDAHLAVAALASLVEGDSVFEND